MLYSLTRRKILGRLLVQVRDELLGGGWHRHRTLENDILRRDGFPVDPFVGFVVWPHGGAGKGDSGEQAPGTRVGENLRPQGHVGGGFGVAAFWSGSSGGVSAKFYLGAKNRVGPAVVHDQQNEVRSLSADLQSETPAFKRHHRWSAPRAVEMLAAAAGHRPAAIAGAEDEGSFNDRWIDNDASGFVDQVLRDVVRYIHDFLNHYAAILEPPIFLAVVGEQRRANKRSCQQIRKNLFHSNPPFQNSVSKQ